MKTLYVTNQNMLAMAQRYNPVDIARAIMRIVPGGEMMTRFQTIREVVLYGLYDTIATGGVKIVRSYWLHQRGDTYGQMFEWSTWRNRLSSFKEHHVGATISQFAVDIETYGFLPWGSAPANRVPPSTIGFENETLQPEFIEMLRAKAAAAAIPECVMAQTFGSTNSSKWNYALGDIAPTAIVSDKRWAGKSKTPDGLMPLPMTPNAYPLFWPSNKPTVLSCQTTIDGKWVQAGSVFYKTYTPQDAPDGCILKVEDADLEPLLVANM